MSSNRRRATGSGCCICVISYGRDRALLVGAPHQCYEHADRHTTMTRRSFLHPVTRISSSMAFATSSGTAPSIFSQRSRSSAAPERCRPAELLAAVGPARPCRGGALRSCVFSPHELMPLGCRRGVVRVCRATMDQEGNVERLTGRHGLRTRAGYRLLVDDRSHAYGCVRVPRPPHPQRLLGEGIRFALW